ncbi:hypothetical protein L2734_13040 [Parashewanella spongiae]|uniref:hypothetical protein n=1 Tax=Parashewanella spongiae TaxID=342950 RepID=UPI0014046FFD|nr:hypothetical protein [Parashewanella spongiae]MCL1079072.1 hypothetical protein [Parashewanella spongiae]
MGILESILVLLGLVPSIDLAESMSQSKTLTMMVIVGICFFSGFAFFLYKMANL